ncbi:uncharacterized protein PSFLO_00920 [Pseudozyma flocculosa]|uniref:Uncharacterized protein n=1 Tax=Pseudozyma flocculosa TaxID=84751 RepID=A0A5C3EWD4_9BASI|nr:uncharacterized protein PSFLO_00920 [Pseudozyma flocculosa]
MARCPSLPAAVEPTGLAPPCWEQSLLSTRQSAYRLQQLVLSRWARAAHLRRGNIFAIRARHCQTKLEPLVLTLLLEPPKSLHHVGMEDGDTIACFVDLGKPCRGVIKC